MKNVELRKYSNYHLKIYAHRYLQYGQVDDLEFVFDRTQEDVDRAKVLNGKYLSGSATKAEISEWMHGMRGALNASDLNRIERNTAVVLHEIGLEVQEKHWDRAAIPRISDYRRLLSDVARIRNGYGVMTGTPVMPTEPLNTYQKWNDIEKILHDVHFVYVQVQADRVYCGTEMYAGEGTGLI